MELLNLKNKKIITGLVFLIIIFSGLASLSGMVSSDGPGEYKYESTRNQEVIIYGQGIYRHMSADVAIQGIAQDYITFFVGIPLLFLGLYFFRKKSLKGLFFLSGILMYFLVTYLFYTAMAMYNSLFLVYAVLLGLSFFALILTIFSFNFQAISKIFAFDKLFQVAGLFLIINSLMVAFLWLSVIIPPLWDGSLYPQELQHYTTLIVQGFDLGLLLPIGMVLGFLAFKKNFYGYFFITIYLIFLSILMMALTSKIVFMAQAGEAVIPVIFIMPTICCLSIIFSSLILKRIKINYN